jgi:hypothetical protein
MAILLIRQAERHGGVASSKTAGISAGLDLLTNG